MHDTFSVVLLIASCCHIVLVLAPSVIEKSVLPVLELVFLTLDIPNNLCQPVVLAMTDVVLPIAKAV